MATHDRRTGSGDGLPRLARASLVLAACVAPLPAAGDPGSAPDGAARAPLRVPGILGSRMVMQRERPVRIWGTAEPGATVRASLGAATATATVDDLGRWELSLPPQPAGGPRALSIRDDGGGGLAFDEILFGEVWLCSGQSNMEWPVRESARGADEIAAAGDGDLRLFTVPHEVAKEPRRDVGGEWRTCTPESVADFSAVAYFFGRELRRELGVPVGLIDSSWGGSLCEAWMSRGPLAADPRYAAILRRGAGDNVGRASGMFNAMIHPLVPLAIRGVAWYQGESNAGRAFQYRRLFPDLIRDWRRHWGEDLPFLYVQLAPLDRHRDEWVELQDAQRRSLAVPHTGMAVIHDLGPPNLHPPEKQEVGRRLALWALAGTYGRSGVVASGPLYRSHAREGRGMRILLDHAAGLASRDGRPLDHFTIAGEDRRFHAATAAIDGPSVVVRAAEVPDPVAVRFGWSDTARPNLINGAGLPASAFRTDDWPGVTDGRD